MGAIFLEVIEWPDSAPDEIIHRIPADGSGDFKLGAQLIVRETQSAVFYRSGKACDSFGPGRHTLTTFNLPIITKLFSAPWAFESIFKAEVYFINHKSFTNLKWGTREPVAFSDKELGMVRLRAFGAFSFRVTEPILFINALVGREARYSTAQIEDFFREVIVSRLNDVFGETMDTIFNLPSKYAGMAAKVKERVQAEFTKYGVELSDFFINSITPPEEVQKMIDTKSGLGAVKNLDDFLKFKLSTMIGQSAPAAEQGSGLGIGLGMGMLLPGFMSKAFSPNQVELQNTAIKTVQCPECLSYTPENSRFCFKCGHQMVVMNACPHCGKVLPPHAKFCMECGHSLSEKTVCPKCNVPLPSGTKFCANCGEKLV